MQVVMGGVNGVWLTDLMSAATGRCNRVTSAVAYATDNNPFFEHCIKNGILVDYFGLLDEDGAVAVAVLKRLLDAGPLKVRARLIKGHFHSKIIWWHGFGAYIGSANLTSSAWFSNVECGVFLEESEIIGTSLQINLEQQFDYLRINSTPLTAELLKALSRLSTFESAAYKAKQRLSSEFESATKDIPRYAGLAACGPASRTTAFTRFTAEWNETLELLRGLCRNFHDLNLRPSWVAPEAEPAVHFDQFLHAYYYVRVRDEMEDEENKRSIELVNRAYEHYKHDPTTALHEAAKWWASLPMAPYGEDAFIGTIAPHMRDMFAQGNLSTWTLEDFQEVFFNVHAFKMHARQVRNVVYGLDKDHKEPMQARSDRLAMWLWTQRREPGQKTVRELLEFLIWGTHPSNMVERLWMVTTDPVWRYDHLGPSSLGEAVGWARPDQYPPRNNRTNKALRSLGHDVRLFSD